MNTAEAHKANQGLSRRSVLAAGLGSAAVGLVLPGSAAAAEPKGHGGAARSLRLAHFTDSHIRPGFRAVEGVTAAWRHLMAESDRPDLVVTGGDLIMFSMDRPADLVSELWKLWDSVYAAECKLPAIHCIGNHDIWGWDTERAKASGDEPLYGKKWWLERVGLQRTYHASEPKRADGAPSGWKIITLDSVNRVDGGYEGRIDDAQFAWLEAELAGTPASTHVLIVSHIPIFCLGMVDCDGLLQTPEQGGGGGGLAIGKGAMMMDCHRLASLFRRYPNVRGQLSGHIHIVERVDYAGMTWICSGAVSGAWWRDHAANMKRMAERKRPGDPPAEQRPPRAAHGYMMVDLYADGTIGNQYVTFGWEPST
ncbi:MAG: metallophosphoesterase [Planctomycetaceae bacterium]|jgi:Icc protein|nr:metallophosphoesterase [Phycisphaerales bacterium]MCE2652696.1 metallophosphoesterase [Planctomycetaceae bacterium]